MIEEAEKEVEVEIGVGVEKPRRTNEDVEMQLNAETIEQYKKINDINSTVIALTLILFALAIYAVLTHNILEAAVLLTTAVSVHFRAKYMEDLAYAEIECLRRIQRWNLEHDEENKEKDETSL